MERMTTKFFAAPCGRAAQRHEPDDYQLAELDAADARPIRLGYCHQPWSQPRGLHGVERPRNDCNVRRQTMMRKTFAALTVLLILCGSLLPAGAQWLTQTIVVTNGWTAAYLLVDASSQNLIPSTPGVPLSTGNPIDKIWLWKAPAGTAQYLITPASPLSGGGPWVSWGLTNTQNSLAAMIPNAAYLIHSSSTTPYTWKIQGRPVPPHYTWDLTGLNFIGFATPAMNPPNFQSFLAPSPIAGMAQIYEYVGGELLAQPANPMPVISEYYTPVTRGQAYWIRATNVNNKYFAPFQITLPDPSGISFGISGGQMTFYIANLTPNTLTVTMTDLTSEPVPYGQTNIVGAPPLLLEGVQNPANLTYTYTTLSTAGGGGASNSVSWTLAPSGQTGSQVAVTLGVNRYSMISSPPGSLFASILQFTDSLGFSSVDIPVSAVSANNAGLWVGQVSVTNVSYDLKSYATNTDGSLTLSQVTNAVVSTNNFVLGTTTNLIVNSGVVSNWFINNYNVTNLYVNTYTTNGAQVVSNSFAVSTNVLLSYGISTNTVIETDVTDYYFDSSGDLYWVTTNIDYPPVVTIETNVSTALVTNQLANLVSTGTPVTITNEIISTYVLSSYLVTNGIFEDPVTNLVFTTNYMAITASNAMALAFTVFGTNQVPGSFSTTNAPVTSIYSTTNLQVFASTVTNSYPVSRPLLAATNGNNVISVNVETNNFSITNVVNTSYTTNSQVINYNYTISQGIANLVSAVTNVIYFHSSSSATITTNSYSNLSLLMATNRLKFSVTNYLASPVSNYVVTAYNTQGDAVPAPFPLRLIVFNDSAGNCSLLQRVYWGLDPNTNIIVSTSQTPLDPSQLSSARRITATHLPWSATNTPWAFTGGPLAQGAVLTSMPIIENYDDQAANPFLHTYHPDHNNLDHQSTPHELPMGSESYQITRVISLSLMPNTNDFISLTSASSRLPGLYNETITLKGLGGFTKNYQTIGSFSLNQISTISHLINE
jgi:hypothetical protein